jgi:two-component system sensor histidine kinase DesK
VTAASAGTVGVVGAGPARRFDTTASLLASVWLVILVVPVATVLTGDDPWWQKVAGTVPFIAFGAVYAVAFGVLAHTPARFSARGRYLFWLALLAALTLVAAVTTGIGSAYLVPFLVAYLAFPLPPARSIAPVTAITVASSWAVFIAGEPYWPGFLGATLVSPVLVYLIAMASHRAEREQQLAHDLDQTRQREAMAVDVHDLLGHSLTVVTLKAELAARLVDTDPAAAKAELAQIAGLSRTALAEVRATVTRIRQPDLAGELAGARRALETAGIAASVPEASPAGAGPNDRLFSWVVREAVTNVVRHSGATGCTVELTGHSVRVHDDGHGFDGVAGNGLQGLRTRVTDAGGTLTVTSDATGTTVAVTMTGDPS